MEKIVKLVRAGYGKVRKLASSESFFMGNKPSLTKDEDSSNENEETFWPGLHSLKMKNINNIRTDHNMMVELEKYRSSLKTLTQHEIGQKDNLKIPANVAAALEKPEILKSIRRLRLVKHQMYHLYGKMENTGESYASVRPEVAGIEEVEDVDWWDLSEKSKDFILQAAKDDGVILELPPKTKYLHQQIYPEKKHDDKYLIPDPGSAKSEINFIADSGAVAHVVKEAVILSNFKKHEGGGCFTGASKHDSAIVKIDGIGDLNLFSKYDDNKLVNIDHVFSASGINANLISLGQFAEDGFGIFLDDEAVVIFDKKTRDVFLTGCYKKPFWIISLSVESKVIKDDKASSSQ